MEKRPDAHEKQPPGCLTDMKPQQAAEKKAVKAGGGRWPLVVQEPHNFMAYFLQMCLW